MRFPLLMVLASYAAGLLMCAWAPWPHSIGWLGTITAVGLVARCRIPRASGHLLLLAILSLVAGYGLTYSQLRTLPADHISRYISGGRWDVAGAVAKPPERWPDRTRLTVRAAQIARDGERHRVRGTIRVTAHDALPLLRPGDRIRVEDALLRAPRNYQNPGAFDYITYCRIQGIAATCSVGDRSRVSLINRASGGGLLGTIYRLKEHIGSTIQTLLPPLQASLLRAMVLGERFSLAADTEETFFTAGTGHLLAISGLHVGFLALFWFFFSRLLLKTVLYRIGRAGQPLLATRLAALITVPPVVAYSLMIGGRVSCIRATIMVVTYLVARFLGRERNLYNTLALAALVILVWKPVALFDIGFQFSFLTVLGLVAVSEHTAFFALKESPADRLRGTRRHKVWNHLFVYPKISLIASIVVFPLTAYYFQRVSVVGIATNSLVVPLALVTIPLGLMASLISLAWATLGEFLLLCASGLVTILYACVKWFAGLYLSPLMQASLPVPTPPAGAVVSYYAAVGTLLFMRRARVARVTLAVACSMFLLTLALKAISHPPDELLRVTYLDVGQGDAALLELPHGRRILLDSGGAYGDRFNMGKAVIMPYLHSRWIGRINMVISSHPQSDHIGGLPPIIREFGVTEYWETASALQCNPPALGAMLTHPATECIRRFPLRDGIYRTSLDGVEFTVLHPAAAFLEEIGRNGMSLPDVNDSSLVVHARYGDVSFLFPGDISKRAEATLLPLGNELRATILKVPHHGGGRSSSPEFLELVRPAVAVFSLGANNIYGHPHPEVVRRYRNIGARILRTDRDGAITIETDGRTYSVRTFVPTEGVR